LRKLGAGDRDRTGDIQLGKLMEAFRSTQNQAHTAGHIGPFAALLALIEHDSEHNFTSWSSSHASVFAGKLRS
jgi:hypothetical protein